MDVKPAFNAESQSPALRRVSLQPLVEQVYSLILQVRFVVLRAILWLWVRQGALFT
jgi:hypothetical protein